MTPNDPLLISIHRELHIPFDYATQRKLPFYPQVALSDLIVAQLDDHGRPLILTAPAAQALAAMLKSAAQAGVSLLPFSGFRSYTYQKGLIERKLVQGIGIEEILTVLAAPGYSEHHTGEAIDITTIGCPPATEAFESTDAYSWLAKHARDFGFTESFPRNNPHKLVFEPWHWRFRAS
jgi:D-alanyl-D-alanine carboxypeptidase